MAEEPVQPSLRRMRRFGVRPDRELGQNFLIDSNILGVIERAAELGREDVVLEIGGGLGVLSEHLAQRVAHVHVVEIDRRLSEALGDAVGGRENVTLHWGDAMELDLRALAPAPGKVVANLPYGIAASVLLRTIHELESVALWVAMVQREVGERLAAAPGSRVYGAPSVLAQLECDVRVLRAIPRTVFFPVPNVDSVLVGMRRRGGTAGGDRAEGGEIADRRLRAEGGEVPGGERAEWGEVPGGERERLRVLVAGAFAHRRKTLAGSLALAGVAVPRERVREALSALGHPADARAERLAPEDFRRLARMLAR